MADGRRVLALARRLCKRFGEADWGEPHAYETPEWWKAHARELLEWLEQ